MPPRMRTSPAGTDSQSPGAPALAGVVSLALLLAASLTWGQAAPAPGGSPPEGWTCHGLLGPMAVISVAPDRPQQVVRAGDRIGQVTVVRVESAGVILQVEGREVLLPLVADAEPPPAAPTPPVPEAPPPPFASGSRKARLVARLGPVVAFAIEPGGFTVSRRQGDALGDARIVSVDPTGPVEVETADGDRHVLEVGESVTVADVHGDARGDVPGAFPSVGFSEGTPTSAQELRHEYLGAPAGLALFRHKVTGQHTGLRPGDRLDGAFLEAADDSEAILRGPEGSFSVPVSTSSPSDQGASDGPELVYLGIRGDRGCFLVGDWPVEALPGEPVTAQTLLLSFTDEAALLSSSTGRTRTVDRTPPPPSPGWATRPVPIDASPPPYPGRQPQWEADLARRLDSTELSLRITQRPLEDVVHLLQERTAVPLLLDPDVFSALSDADLTVSVDAAGATLRGILDQLVAGRPLRYGTLLGQVVIGLRQDLDAPLALRRARHHWEVAIATVRQASARLARQESPTTDDAMLARLTALPPHHPTAERLRDLLREIATAVDGQLVILSAPGTGPDADDWTQAPGRLLPGENLADALRLTLEARGQAFLWQGNTLVVGSPEQLQERRARERAGWSDLQALRVRMTRFDRSRPLGVALHGVPLWQAARQVTAAGQVELVTDEAAWRSPDVVTLPGESPTVGDLLDWVATRADLAVAATDPGRIFLFSGAW